jgi:membrane carboxypeptidase/penicillin-binding protein
MDNRLHTKRRYGVWIGNTDGTGLGYNADGYNAAALIFNDVMTKALEDYPDEPFPKPEGIKEIKISTASGKLPGSNTPAEFIMSEIFASFAVPTETENLSSKWR